MYKKTYYILFNAITDALRSNSKEEADEILKNAQIRTEEFIIESKEEI